jgi:hypothetical protein
MINAKAEKLSPAAAAQQFLGAGEMLFDKAATRAVVSDLLAEHLLVAASLQEALGLLEDGKRITRQAMAKNDAIEVAVDALVNLATLFAPEGSDPEQRAIARERMDKAGGTLLYICAVTAQIRNILADSMK